MESKRKEDPDETTTRNGLGKRKPQVEGVKCNAGTEISKNEWLVGSSSSSDEEQNSTLKENGDIPPGWIFSYYKRIDQYWNVFPKTDYTYLPSSPYNGKQVAPGIPVIPNMSRRGISTNSLVQPAFSRTTVNHLYSSSSTSRSSTPCTNSRNHFRSQFNLSNSDEILQNIHNSQKQTGWQRLRDVWTSVWKVITTMVVTIVETTVTVVFTTSRTTAGRCRTLISSTPLKFFLLPLLLIVLLIYFFRGPLVDALNLKKTVVNDDALESSLGIDYDLLVSPLHSLCGTANSAFVLVTRSVLMIPTLVGQAASVVWSFLVFWPSHIGGIFMNKTAAEEQIISTDYYTGGSTKTPMRDEITVDKIRNVVIDVLREQEEKSKMEREKSSKDQVVLSNEIEEKTNLVYMKMIERLKEMADQLRDEDQTKIEGLESMLRKQIEEAKKEIVDVESLKNSVGTLVENRLKENMNNLKQSLEQDVSMFKYIKTEDFERLVTQVLAKERMPDKWRKEMEVDLKEKVDRCTSEVTEDMRRELQEETNGKLKERLSASFNSWLDMSRRELSSSLEQQHNEWKTMLETLEARLDEFEKGNVKKEEMVVMLTNLRTTTLQEIQMRIKQLEMAVFTNDATSGLSDSKGKRSEVTSSSEKVVWEDIQHFVVESMEKVLSKYHADRLGVPDYALQSNGGWIVSIRCTKSFPHNGYFYVLGMPMWLMHTSPDTIIKPGIIPGECWAFEGSEGYVIIKLAMKIKVTSFTMEHVPKEISIHGQIDSAPKDFSVWGLKSEKDLDPLLLGNFEFLDNGESLQQFKAKEYDTVETDFDMVELRIETNHGHLNYTCLYRFRVHGIPATSQK